MRLPVLVNVNAIHFGLFIDRPMAAQFPKEPNRLILDTLRNVKHDNTEDTRTSASRNVRGA
jgi:hypothetical protein